MEEELNVRSLQKNLIFKLTQIPQILIAISWIIAAAYLFSHHSLVLATRLLLY